MGTSFSFLMGPAGNICYGVLHKILKTTPSERVQDLMQHPNLMLINTLCMVQNMTF